jgi:DNA-binding NtrC family response regulator
MQKPEVIVVAGNRQDGQKFCEQLTNLNYIATQIHHPEDLEGVIQKCPNIAVFFDLDTVRPEKQFFRSLKKRHPRLHILGVSSQAYHPGLEEVIGSHLYACLMKPLDMEELSFWLKTISENLAEGETIAEG